MFSIVTESQLALDGNYDRVCCLKHVGTEGSWSPFKRRSLTPFPSRVNIVVCRQFARLHPAA
jgi:hypothetical protein